MTVRTLLLALVVLMTLPGLAVAVNPDEILDDPVLESRARGLTIQLRCLVCQNQSIDDSDAELARDLRLLVRERLVAGDSDREVMAYIVDRYGDFVLLRPPFKLSTVILWSTPVAGLLIGLYFIIQRRRRPNPGAAATLTAEEETRLDAVLKKLDRE